MKKKGENRPTPRVPPPQQNKHERHNVRDLWMRHDGEDIFVVGTGTSMAEFDWTRLNGKVTIALNDALKAPFVPSYHLFSDIGIWVRYRDLSIDPETIVVCQRKARDQFIRWSGCKFKEQVYHFNHVGQMKQTKVENDDLYVSRTVATGGICMAWKLGARRIFLLGVDGYKKRDGVYYWDGSKKPPNEKRQERELDPEYVTQDRHDWWKKNMHDLKQYFLEHNLFQERFPGSGVFNLSNLSVIDAWEKVSADKVFECHIGMQESNSPA